LSEYKAVVGQQLAVQRLPCFRRKSEALLLPDLGLIFTKGHLTATFFMRASVLDLIT